MTKYCVLNEDKVCDDCGECNVCDLDPNKICDNCMKCLNTGADYRAIEIDEIVEDDSAPEEYEQLRQDLAEITDDEDPLDWIKKPRTKADWK
ncbi:MAG: hypothetical protein IJ124_00805 [Clostridia bacterium]|nr:hypothetical protein [Clostridia bacterium]